MRRHLPLITILLAAGFLVSCGESTPRPNVLLISIDSLRRDYLGVYGRTPLFADDVDVSPELDRLADESIVFEDALATTSWTLPSHIALMTGMSDRWHGVEMDDFRRDPLHQTVAARFRAKGYRTAGFFSGPYLDPKYGFDEGFEGYLSGMAAPDEKAARLKEWIAAMPAGEKPGKKALRLLKTRLYHTDITSPRVNSLAKSFLDDADSRPFFLFLHYFDAHYDYLPDLAEPGLSRRFDPDYEGEMTGSNWYMNPAVRRLREPRERRISDRDLAHVQALYEAEIHWVDRHVGLIIERLKAIGEWENTIVAVVSDHGDEFFEHGSIGHRSTLHAEQLRVPLILRIPGGTTGGTRVNGVARIYDVAPTLLDYAGLDSLPHAEGTSLRSLIEGDVDDHGALGRIYVNAKRGFNVQDSWRDSRYAVIRRLEAVVEGGDSQEIVLNQQFPFQVFDRREDPGELEPLLETDPRYTEAVDAFRADFAISEKGAKSIPRSPSSEWYGSRKSTEEQEMLDSLGYTSGSARTSGRPPRKAFPPPQPRH
jgi:arylsulfatase A-like enzyme